MRARLRRVALVGAALLIGLLLCEGGLRMLTAAYRFGTERGVRSADELGPGGKTFVCLGDSNTFGLWVDGDDSYPSRLQGLLDERVAGGPHRVVNLGIPGLNSRQVHKRLSAALEDYEPDGVLVLAGFNDRWAWTPGADDDVLVDPPWYESLRLVRFVRLAMGRGRDAGELARTARQQGLTGGTDRTGREFLFQRADYDKPVELDSVRRSLTRSLRAMCTAAEQASVPIYFLTYASGRGAYGLANRTARDVGAECSARLIDPQTWFGNQNEVAPDKVFFPDDHPRELGYEIFARLVCNGLIEQLAIEAVPFESLTTHLVSRAAPPVLLLNSERTALTVRRERPGRRFAMLLSLAGEEPAASIGTAELPLRDDQMFRRTLADVRLRGVVGPDGVGSISIAHVLDDASLAGRSLIAVSVSWDGEELVDPTVSMTVEFQIP